MAERGQGWASLAIAAVALAAILGGLVLSGGPGQGRMERRDRVRLDDLMAIWRQAECRSLNGAPLDGALTPTAACPAEPRRADPQTGAAYRIEPVDARNLRLCADFELPPEELSPGWVGERQGDCLVMRLPEIAIDTPDPGVPPPPLNPNP